jgi:hypothetical protein
MLSTSPQALGGTLSAQAHTHTHSNSVRQLPRLKVTSLRSLKRLVIDMSSTESSCLAT